MHLTKIALASLIALLPVHAMALSCMPPSIEAAYGRAAESSDVYMVVAGTLVFDESKLPKRGSGANKPPRNTHISGRMSGHFLSAQGFVTPFDQAVTVNAQCFGPWCGSTTSGAQQLAFVKKSGGGFELQLDPCASTLFTTPSAKQLDAAIACINGAACR